MTMITNICAVGFQSLKEHPPLTLQHFYLALLICFRGPYVMLGIKTSWVHMGNILMYCTICLSSSKLIFEVYLFCLKYLIHIRLSLLWSSRFKFYSYVKRLHKFTLKGVEYILIPLITLKQWTLMYVI